MRRAAKKKAAKKAAKPAGRVWFVYMLECRGRRIYTGITPDVQERYAKHRAGRGAAFTRINPPLRVLAAMACANHSLAAQTEAGLKKLARPAKLQWAAQWPWCGEDDGAD